MGPDSRSTQSLLAEPALLDVLIDRLPIGISLWRAPDLEDPDGFVLLAANPAAARPFGVEAASLVGRMLGEIAPGPRRHEGLIADAARRNEPVCLGTQTVERDEDEPLALETLAVPLGADLVALVTTDVTRRDHAEDALERARVDLRRLLDQIPDGVAVLVDHAVAYANPALARLAGEDDAEALVGRGVEALAHPESLATALAEIHLAESGRMAMAEGSLRHRDGHAVPVEAHAVKMDFEGRDSIFGIIRDLTERRELMTRLLQTDRLAALGTLASGVAHELNNPLAYVASNVRFALDEIVRLRQAAGPDLLPRTLSTTLAELDAALSDAFEGTERLRRIVADVKSFGRSDTGEQDLVDVREVMERCLDLAEHEIRQRSRLTRRFADVSPIAGNATRLGQVFLNLLVNASQAVPEGDAAGNEVTVAIEEKDGAVVVSVADTGVGVTEEARHRLFDPFFTTRPVGDGAGLGLAVSHGIVRSLGGTIEVESAPGRGSVFSVILPAVTGDVVEADPGTAAHPAIRGRILVIDDEAMIGLALRRTLGKVHEVITAARASDALLRIEAGPPFDVILCDLSMPDISGMDLYLSLTEPMRERVVFITGGVAGERARAFLARHAITVIEKPFDAEALERLIEARVRAIRER